MKKLKDETLFRLMRDYLNVYLPNQKCCSLNTIKSYRESLNLLFDFITTQKAIPLTDITFEVLNSQTIIEFLDWMEKEHNWGISTRNHRLSSIRSFFKYAGNMELTMIVYQNEIKKIPLKKNKDAKVVEFMTEQALKTVLEQPDTSTKNGIRDLFFMILMYDTGARDREVLDMKVKDFCVDSKNPYVYLTGKGEKTRVVPVMTKTVNHFHQYLKIFHSPTEKNLNQYLFYTVRHGIKQQMSDDNVARFMKIYGTTAKKKCGEIPKKVHPHLFRHTRAMHLYRAGMPLALLSEWLGHAQLETTLIYAYADTEMKREAIKRATGANNPLIVGENPAYWKNDDELIKKLYGLK
ncbi:MAG: tyrosine-type recombinase/integrase [Sporolactobacillus sp.]